MASSNGLIDNFADVKDDQVPQVQSTSYQAAAAAPAPQAATEAGKATLGTVTDDQTVQGRLKGIVDANGPLQQQAATAGLQGAASRGLVNSSIAVGAAQDALYKSALPIASQDANTYATQSKMNQDAQNQMEAARAADTNQNARFNASTTAANNQFNAASTNQAGATNAAAANTASGQNASIQAQAMAQKSKQAADLVLQQLDAGTRTNLVNIEANYKTLMQASQSASDLYQQVVNTIGTIQNNKDLDANSRNVLIGQQTQLLQSGMNLLGNINNLDLSKLLDFSALQGPGTPPPTPSRESIGPAYNPNDYRETSTGA